MPSEEVEEYLEAIWDIAGKDGMAKTTEIAKKMGNSPSSVTEALKRMQKAGLVKHTPYKGSRLTKKGSKNARSVKRKHRLLERFLTDFLKLDKEKVHDQACKMEHSLSDEAEEALCKMMQGPNLCPHGQQIPPCDVDVDSCVQCQTESGTVPARRSKDLSSITDLKPGQKAKIAFIRGGMESVKRLSDLGLTPGTQVQLQRSAPLKGPVQILVRGSMLAVGRGIANRIFITLVEA